MTRLHVFDMDGTLLRGTTARWPATRAPMVGLGVLLLGQLRYTSVLDGGYISRLLPACVLCGTGIAFVYPAATLLASSAASPDRQATANGVLTTSQQIGGAFGVALVAAIQAGGGTTQHALWACAVITGSTMIVVSVLLHYQDGDTPG